MNVVVRLEFAFDRDRGGHGLARLERHVRPTLDLVRRRRQRRLRFDVDIDAAPVFDRRQLGALVIENVERNLRRHAQRDRLQLLALAIFLDRAQYAQRHRADRTNDAAAFAVRAGDRGPFDHARTQALARHFEQAERTDAPELNACAIVAQRILQPLLNRAVVAVLLHVDEVDDDEAREVAQTQLPRDLFGRFQVRLERRVLDVVLARRLARVHVDRDQSLGLVDDDVAARAQTHHGIEHAVERGFDAEFLIERHVIAVMPHRVRMARHQHRHEAVRFVVAVLALDLDLADLLRIEIADRALDQIAFLVHAGRRHRLQRQLAHCVPLAHQIFEVALDLLLRAVRTGGANDHAHAVRNLELARHFLELAPVGDV